MVPAGGSRHSHNNPLTGLDAPLMVTQSAALQWERDG